MNLTIALNFPVELSFRLMGKIKGIFHYSLTQPPKTEQNEIIYVQQIQIPTVACPKTKSKEELGAM